ncbi:MAG: nucleotidyltransferase family protein [Abditibacteriota bacterium]|nr:nucleotidyltransferase family protein [Abditibacteriota bacterium]
MKGADELAAGNAGLLLSLIRLVLTGEAGDGLGEVTEEQAQAALGLARRQSLEAMAAEGLLRVGKWPEELQKQLKNVCYRQLLYSELQAEERRKVYALLEEAGAEYVPLKGDIIASLYPEPYMRRSSDVDILIREEKLGEVGERLKQAGFKLAVVSGHDHHYVSDRLSLELHYQLEGSGLFTDAPSILDRVWDYVIPAPDSLRRDMTGAFCYFYTTAHIVRHFLLTGGCGLRSVIDLWLLRRSTESEAEQRDGFLRQHGLKTFSDEICGLGEDLFGNSGRDPDPGLLEVVFGGTVFRSDEGQELGNIARQDGRLRHVVRIVFPPLAILENTYPVMRGRPWMYPGIVVYRLFKGVWFARRNIDRMSAITGADREEVQKRRAVLQQLDLLKK